MRKRVIKKLFSLTVASSMILSLTACGNTGNTAAEETQETADAADTEKTEDSEEGITLTAAGYDARYFDEEGNMQLPLTDGSYTYKILWKKFATDVGTPEDKYMLQQALEATGIKVEIEEVSEQAWEEKLSVVFASGDLPDLILGETNNLINYLDQCLDLTELFPMYCPFMSDFFLNEMWVHSPPLGAQANFNRIEKHDTM